MVVDSRVTLTSYFFPSNGKPTRAPTTTEYCSLPSQWSIYSERRMSDRTRWRSTHCSTIWTLRCRSTNMKTLTFRRSRRLSSLCRIRGSWCWKVIRSGLRSSKRVLSFSLLFKLYVFCFWILCHCRPSLSLFPFTCVVYFIVLLFSFSAIFLHCVLSFVHPLLWPSQVPPPSHTRQVSCVSHILLLLFSLWPRRCLSGISGATKKKSSLFVWSPLFTRTHMHALFLSFSSSLLPFHYVFYDIYFWRESMADVTSVVYSFFHAFFLLSFAYNFLLPSFWSLLVGSR